MMKSDAKEDEDDDEDNIQHQWHQQAWWDTRGNTKYTVLFITKRNSHSKDNKVPHLHSALWLSDITILFKAFPEIQ